MDLFLRNYLILYEYNIGGMEKLSFIVSHAAGKPTKIVSLPRIENPLTVKDPHRALEIYIMSKQ